MKLDELINACVRLQIELTRITDTSGAVIVISIKQEAFHAIRSLASMGKISSELLVGNDVKLSVPYVQIHGVRFVAASPELEKSVAT